MMHKVYLYPLWLRIWHWVNACLFIVLIATGVSMHYSGSGELFLPFSAAMKLHNIAGLLLAGMYLFYFFLNITSLNIRNYIPGIATLPGDMLRQAKFYLYGIFRGSRHPFEPVPGRKFNALQQVTYIFIMFFFMPVIIVSGLFLMYPMLLPDGAASNGSGGVFPVALGHSITGYLLSLFMFGHIYLGTTGDTSISNFKSMWNGWHESHAEDLTEDAGEADDEKGEEAESGNAGNIEIENSGDKK